ncbi:tripartite motif-containing protein 40-like [Sparus aurata]|uniref:tripartite motif-containing protein 40-like n=1 Tax=Sparus aurata TaxID=8175 RepID=UPI0011C179C5|nr:tripartite motif-containing protein 40-like [Sparus aurata]
MAKQQQEHVIDLDQSHFCCSVCLDLLKEPVTIPCGHTYCKVCIEGCWDQEEQRGKYSCPQCREEFSQRPVLRKNNMLAEVVGNLQASCPAAVDLVDLWELFHGAGLWDFYFEEKLWGYEERLLNEKSPGISKTGSLQKYQEKKLLHITMVLAFKAFNGTSPLYLQTLRESTSRIYIRWPAGTPIADSKQSPLSKVATLLCFGTSVVERTPDQCQDSGITPSSAKVLKTHLFGLQLDPT